MVVALARGLRLSLDERDHLFRLAGHCAPSCVGRSDHVSAALLRVLDRLHDTPAQVISDLGEARTQNRPAVALLGDQRGRTGHERSSYYRWCTEPAARELGDIEVDCQVLHTENRAQSLLGFTTQSGSNDADKLAP